MVQKRKPPPDAAPSLLAPAPYAAAKAKAAKAKAAKAKAAKSKAAKPKPTMAKAPKATGVLVDPPVIFKTLSTPDPLAFLYSPGQKINGGSSSSANPGDALGKQDAGNSSSSSGAMHSPEKKVNDSSSSSAVPTGQSSGADALRKQGASILSSSSGANSEIYSAASLRNST